MQVKQPILFLSGLQDEMVPPSHMQMLYAKAAVHNKQCIFVDFPTGMHMDTWLSGGDHYWRTIQDFLSQHAPEKKENGTPRKDDGKSLFLLSLLLSHSMIIARILPQLLSIWQVCRQDDCCNVMKTVSL